MNKGGDCDGNLGINNSLLIDDDFNNWNNDLFRSWAKSIKHPGILGDDIAVYSNSETEFDGIEQDVQEEYQEGTAG